MIEDVLEEGERRDQGEAQALQEALFQKGQGAQVVVEDQEVVAVVPETKAILLMPQEDLIVDDST